VGPRVEKLDNLTGDPETHRFLLQNPTLDELEDQIVPPLLYETTGPAVAESRVAHPPP